MIEMTQRKALFWAMRPKTLPASIAPIALATLCLPTGKFSFWIFLCTLLFAIAIQIGTNLANDYFDYIKGSDLESRIGPARACQKGWISPDRMKLFFSLTFVAAALISIPLIQIGGLFALSIVILSIVLAIIYTGGPYPLAYVGLGDLFVFLFFGPIATLGTYFLQTKEFAFDPLIFGIGTGLLSTAILTVNNLRDVADDTKTGKRTLIVRFGKDFGRYEYTFCLLFASFTPLILFREIFFGLCFTILLLLFAFPLVRKILIFKDPRSLLPMLGKTAQFLLIYALFISLRVFLQ